MIHGWEIWLYFCAILIMGGLGTVAWHQRKVTGALAFTIFMFGLTQWIVGILLCFISPNYQEKLFWLYYYIFAVNLALTAWVGLALHMTGAQRWLHSRIASMVVGFLIILFVLTVCNDHGCFLYSPRLNGPRILGETGPLYWVNMVSHFSWVCSG